jgi:hypothetical protein
MDDFEYREPQMVIDLPDFDDWFNYYYEGVEGVCIYPFEVLDRNWGSVESLREDIYELARENFQSEIEQYVEELSVLLETREELREEEEVIDEMIRQVPGITPELHELLHPELYSQLVEEGGGEESP